MHLLDIPTGFWNNVFAVTSCKLACNARIVYRKDARFPSFSKFFCIQEKTTNIEGVKLCRGGLTIRAVATFEEEVTKSNHSSEEDCNGSRVKLSIESRSLDCSVIEQQSQIDLDESEELRRMRIPKSRKGKIPWNKGRKHSPETLQRIRERTRLAMQDPEVKLKLINSPHPQSSETRMKIGARMQLNWVQRRKKVMLQKTCYYEWQNLLAEASRKGLFGEEELQWDSYEILSEQLEQELLLQSIKKREKRSRHGGRNSPKAAEHRRKISKAIAAKWADPEYRTRVFSGRYRGVPDGVERKRRPKPSSNEQSINGLALHKPKSQTQEVSLKRKSIPKYKDPLASSKLEMLKNIKAQRAVTDNKKNEVFTRAKLLIAEAEKAAKALEIAAMKSSVARASLFESRELIAKALNYIESIDIGDDRSVENGTVHSLNAPTEPTNVDDVTNTDIKGSAEADRRKSIRDHPFQHNGGDIHNFKFPLLNEEEDEHKPWPNGFASQPPAKPTAVSKKWVRGRLVDATGEG